MNSAGSRGRHATTEQLRGAIDRGATGSKVPYHDPAAAPLGTDEEAAGTPPSPGVVADTLERETRNPAAHTRRGHAAVAAGRERGHQPDDPPADPAHRERTAMVGLALAAALATAVTVLAMALD